MKSIGGRVEIHCHNDIGMAISNSIIAVEEEEYAMFRELL